MPRNALVVAIDRLGAGMLGPYGNSWLPTPGFCRLAAESLLVEFALADATQLAETYRSYWEGTHAASRLDRLAGPAAPLMELCAAAGIETRLLTDEPRLVVHPHTASFDRLERLEAPDDAETAPRAEETQLGNLFFTASEQLAALRAPSLLWLHSRGLSGPWDAPLELRRSLADEEDPTPPDFTAPPSLVLPPDPDPDEVLGIQQAAGGQAMVVDMALDVLLDALDASPLAQETLLIVTSPRGLPLGEHGAIGDAAPGLYEELIHVPLLLRFPDRMAAAGRTGELAQPADLFATLAEWFGLSEAAGVRWGRSLIPVAREDAFLSPTLALCVAGEERALRSPVWQLRQTPERTATAAEQTVERELYVKPDDRWEVNDVANRCGDALEAMTAALAQFEQAAATGQRDSIAELPAAALAAPE